MNKDEIKGKAKDVAGRAQRQVGEWTGDEEAQAEGTAKQAEGKLQNAWGKVKKEGEELADDIKDRDKKDRDVA
ncbi:MAG: CsbD family protein [Candidatus Korobacteraceae bacterium]